MTAILLTTWATTIVSFIKKLGGLGLLVMGILDSSFLFLPFGNDLLLIAMVSSNRDGFAWILYVLLSAVGSVIGVLLLDLVMRRMGEEGLERFVKPERVKRLKCKMDRHAGWAVFLATIIPPPFPFTAVVLTASALQCSRKALLLSVFMGRLVRFTAEAVLAVFFGRQILRVMNSDVIDYFVYGLIAVAVVGSIFSVRKWLSRPRATPAMRPRSASE